jgi:hypothetical protein
MATIPTLIADLVTLLLRLPLLGGLAVGLFVFRELFDVPRRAVLRAAFDFGLVLLALLVTVLAIVRIAQVPPHV